MKKFLFIFLSIATLILACSCGCNHVWSDATCDAPKTCTKCGVTEGKSLGDIMAEGNYTEAYKKANSTEKDIILAENVLAVLSQKTSDNLKDPSSFVLRKGYCYAFTHEDGIIGYYGILYVSGKNSFGGTVSSYRAYTLGKNKEWNYIGSVDSRYEEDDDDAVELITKIVVQAGIDKGYEISREQVNRINGLFKSELLYNVDEIEWESVDTSNFKKSE